MRIVKTIQVGGSFAKWTANPPDEDDIDADNDGRMTPAHQFEVDLSKIASTVLGRQASMMASYKLHSITAHIRSSDDIIDNDESTAFQGRMWFTPPTDHAIEALKLARKAEKASEAASYDADSLFLSTEDDYSGFRYGYQFTNAVDYVTTSNISGIPSWTLEVLEAAYNSMNPSTKVNALWTGRFPEECNFQWQCANATGDGDGDSPPILGDSRVPLNHLTLPLLRGAVEWSSGDEAGSVDDDYFLWFTIEFTPEVRVW